MKTPMLDCESVMRQLWDYLDKELTPERMAAIKAHLAMCGRCHPQAEFERSFLRAIARVHADHPDSAGLGERVRASLRLQGFQSL